MKKFSKTNPFCRNQHGDMELRRSEILRSREQNRKAFVIVLLTMGIENAKLKIPKFKPNLMKPTLAHNLA
jgi:hypothetical protein